WGGRSFDGQHEKNRRCMPSFFFLPQIELIRFDQQWSLAVNLTEDKARTLAGLRKLICDVAALPPISSHIRSIVHTPIKSEWDALVHKVLTG
ncbi:hypothetical protein OFN56_32410, partial [Escherichia coli]|nr:hypothetical protein [Escherichia coli]